jgi:hypothetical protein
MKIRLAVLRLFYGCRRTDREREREREREMGGTILVGAPQGCDSAWGEYEWLWRTGSNVESIVAYFNILSRYLRNSRQCRQHEWNILRLYSAILSCSETSYVK